MKFTDILHDYRIDYREAGAHHHVCEGFVGLDCPFCSPGSGKFKLGYNLARGFTTCWSCGPHRTAEVLGLLTGLSPGACYSLLGGIDFEKWRGTRLTGKLEMPRGVGPLLGSHKKYLRERGFDPGAVERLWRVQGIGHIGDFPHSLFIPIYFRGELVSWTTRRCSHTSDFRYGNARPDQERVSAKSLLYGEDYCGHTACVCEGPTDVWRIGPGAVCTFGMAFSKEQLNRLAKYAKVLVCFDGERQAQRRADRLAEEIAVVVPSVARIELPGCDPGSAPERHLNAIREMLA